MATDRSQLSPRGAIVTGLLFIACGLPPIMIGMGLLTPDGLDSQTPPWVAVCAGLMFSIAGVLIIVDYAVGDGIAADGAGPPRGRPATQIGRLLMVRRGNSPYRGEAGQWGSGFR
jgi:hypothetical protein